MRVLIDGRSLIPLSEDLGPTGIGRWTDGVLRALAALRPDWELVVMLLHPDGTIDAPAYGANVSFRPLRFSERWARRLQVARLLPRIDRWAGGADVVVAPNFVTWPSTAPTIPVIHDMTFVRYPEYVSKRNGVFLRLMVPRMLQRSPVVATVSHAVADEISSHYDYPADRIVVVPNAVDPAAVEQADGVTDDDDGFILFVGTMEPRKNLIGVLRAHRILRSDDPSVPRLVIAGGKGWRNEAIEQELAVADPDRVEWLGYVDETRLRSLYRRASVLAFPSLYEGFGLPVLEAMAAGCPVVTTRRGGIPEVAADAARYVEPDDPADIAAGLRDVLAGSEVRRRMSAQGRDRVAAFSWTSSAQSLQTAIEKAARSRK